MIVTLDCPLCQGKGKVTKELKDKFADLAAHDANHEKIIFHFERNQNRCK